MRLVSLCAVLLFPLAVSASSMDEGLHAMIAGDYPRAAQLLATAVAERPHDPVAHFNYASTLRALGQYNDALVEYQAALREARDPKLHSDVLYGIALTRNQQADPALAAAAWRSYLAFSSGRGETGATQIARQNLASAEREIGIRKAAR
jgi:tetratricopeptide (TPR) repeat protein